MAEKGKETKENINAILEDGEADYDINSDDLVNDNIFKTYEQFENTEVNISYEVDDNSWDAFDEVNKTEICLPEIPSITFVDENFVGYVVEDTQSSSSKIQSKLGKKFQCEKCKKQYIRELAYAKHVSNCNKSTFDTELDVSSG